MKRIYLVSCVSKKSATPAMPVDLYQSTWFKKARQYMEKWELEWYVLSAKHHILHPYEDAIQPYDESLHDLNAQQRKEWSWTCLKQIIDIEPDSVVFFAGKKYREYLGSLLRAAGIEVSCPLEGLGIGQQLKWFNERREI